MLEKRFAAVPPQAFTANGTTDGKITIFDSSLFKVKQVVTLTGNTLPPLELEIKRITDLNTIYVGPLKGNIDTRSDISAYTLALASALFANEQKRPSIDLPEYARAVYEEEPTVAIRTVLVDDLGNKISEANPLPVQVDTTVNIGDVRITAQDNDPNPGNVHSSVRISDGNDDLEVNTDGSINVKFVPGPGATVKSFYNEVTSVANSVMTTVLTYTVPAATISYINSVDVSGTNIAQFQVEVNAAVIDKKRTYWSGPINEVFSFNGSVTLAAGDIVRVRVIHVRPFVGDFNARLSVLEQI